MTDWQSEYEKKLEEVKALGEANAKIPLGMEGSDLMVVATLLNFISLEIGMLVRLNLEILKELKHD